MKKKKMAGAVSKNQVSDPGPSWPSCLPPLAVGQRAYVMAHCPSCVCLSVRPSIRLLTFF